MELAKLDRSLSRRWWSPKLFSIHSPLGKAGPHTFAPDGVFELPKNSEQAHHVALAGPRGIKQLLAEFPLSRAGTDLFEFGPRLRSLVSRHTRASSAFVVEESADRALVRAYRVRPKTFSPASLAKTPVGFSAARHPFYRHFKMSIRGAVIDPFRPAWNHHTPAAANALRAAVVDRQSFSSQPRMS